MTLMSTTQFPVQNYDQDLIKKTIFYEQNHKSPNTIRMYNNMWKQFISWCESKQLCPLPASAEAIAMYLSDIAEKSSFSKIDIVVAAIEFMHMKHNVSINGDSHIYRNVRKGIRRVHAEKSLCKKAKPLSIIDLAKMSNVNSSDASELRDKTLILLGFFGAFRRSELVSLDVEQVQFTDKGLQILLLRSKRHIEPVYISISIAKKQEICPVYHLKMWLEVAGISSGPIFQSVYKSGKITGKRLSGESVSDILKKYFSNEHSGHSMRRGLITEEASRNIPIGAIAKHSRHKDLNVLMGYIDLVQGYDSSTVKMLGV